MATFEDIARANESIRTMTIERMDRSTGRKVSKEYAEVNQRIKAFRMVYPEGTIYTEMISDEDGVCIFRAKVYGSGDPAANSLLGVGHAYEKEGSSNINKTSYIENCETSAVGRALGMAGFGIDTSVASYEEVQNAILNQEEPKGIGPNEVGALRMLCDEVGVDVVEMCKYFKHDSIPEFTYMEWKQTMDLLTKRKERQNASDGSY